MWYKYEYKEITAVVMTQLSFQQNDMSKFYNCIQLHTNSDVTNVQT